MSTTQIQLPKLTVFTGQPEVGSSLDERSYKVGFSEKFS